MGMIEVCFGDILVILFLIYLVVGNIIRFIYWIKFCKIKRCERMQCRYWQHCNKQMEQYTQEEIEYLYRIIKKFKEETSETSQPHG